MIPAVTNEIDYYYYYYYIFEQEITFIVSRAEKS